MATPTFLASNGHYYEIKSGIQYTPTDLLGDAIKAASGASYRGLYGYLATITSSTENTLIVSLLNGNISAYIGASNNENANIWKWITGPESGTLVGSSGYTNWYPGEPTNNRFGTSGVSSENALAISTSSKWQGRWWDAPDFYTTDISSIYLVVEYGGLPANYKITPSSLSVNEGSSVTFTVNTTNIEWGKSVPYSISGISATDLSSGQLTGSITVTQNGLDGIASLRLDFLADNLVEGTENITITIGDQISQLTVYDTSTPTPTFAVSANSASVNEGATANFTITTSNVSAGTSIAYTLSGVSSPDITGGLLAGFTAVNSAGTATVSIPIAADNVTEGTETLTISIQGKTASTVINDTSKSAETNAIYSDYTKHYYQAFTNNVSWSSALSLANAQSYRGLQGYLVTITSQYEDDFVSNNIVKPSGITGYSFSSGYKSFWIGASDENSEGKWVWMAGPESGQTVYQYGGSNNNQYANFYLPVYSSSSADADYLYGNVPVENASTFPGNINRIFWDDLWNNPIMSGQSGNGYVVEFGGLPATYNLYPSSTSVNEGSDITFTLNTTNVEWGTLLNYTISGVSSGDITGGALSGTVIVSSNGNATITIPIASDLTTEGTESLTVTAQGISASVLIADKSPTPIVVTPITTVTSIPYGDGKYFFGSAGSDKVTGTSFVDVVKQTSTISSNQLTKLSDGSWQVQNKISPSNSDNLVNVERIEFSDISVALDVSGPAGQVAKILGSVFGQSYVSNTEFAGIGFAYLDGGMSYLDLCGLAAGAAGLSSPDLLVTTLLKNTTGTEPTALSKSSYLQLISNGASYASVVQQVADSSANAQSIKLTDLANTGLAYTPYVLPPTYSLSATTASINEGLTAVFNLTTTNVAVGTEVSYTLSGISPSDLMTDILTGKVTIGAGGTASISVPIAADGATEGQESLTISAQGATASIVINDTSKGSAAPTYTLTPAALSVNEGELARVYVNTTNVAAGTVLQYGVSGVNANDLIGDLTRLVTVDSLGQAFINLQTVADQITEGPETMYITLGTSTTSFLINDTSITLVGVIDNGGGDGGGGGGGGGD